MMHTTRITLFGAASIAATAFALCPPTAAMAQSSKSAPASKSTDRPAVKYSYTVEYSPNAFDIARNYHFALSTPAHWIAVPMPYTNIAQRVDSYELTLNGKPVSFEVKKSEQGMPWAVVSIQGLTTGDFSWRAKGILYNARIASATPGSIPDWAPRPPAGEELAKWRTINDEVASIPDYEEKLEKFLSETGLKSNNNLIEYQETLYDAFAKSFVYDIGGSRVNYVFQTGKMNCNGGAMLFAAFISRAGFVAINQYGIESGGAGHQNASTGEVGMPVGMTNVMTFNDGRKGLDAHYGAMNFLVISEGTRNILRASMTIPSGNDVTLKVNAVAVHSAYFFGADGERLQGVGGAPVKQEFRPLTAEQLAALPKQVSAQGPSTKALALPSPSKSSSKKR